MTSPDETRTAAKAERLAALGAAPVVADALDRAALRASCRRSRRIS
jgi:hypothetical protein